MTVKTARVIHGEDLSEYREIAKAIDIVTEFRDFLEENEVDTSEIDQNTFTIFYEKLQEIFSNEGIIIDIPED